jgi:hypothetical protein
MVKRYELESFPADSASMEECLLQGGDWVKYSDYLKVCEALGEALEIANQWQQAASRLTQNPNIDPRISQLRSLYLTISHPEPTTDATERDSNADG